MARMSGATAGAIEREGVGDVEPDPCRGLGVSGRHHVGYQGKIHGQIQAEAESADRHADQVAVEAARRRDHEHRRGVDDRRGHHEGLASTRAVGEPSPDQRGDDDADGLDQRAEIDLPRHLRLGGSQPLQQVVGLVGGEEGVAHQQQETGQESPGEVRAAARVDIEGGGELPCRPPGLRGRV